jgi:hypothetical protein
MGSDAPPRTRNTRDAGWLPARSQWSSRDNLAGVLAAAGALLLPVAMSLPWYRDAADGGTLSAWGGYWFVMAEMLVLFLAGAGLALSVLAGRPLGGPAVTVVIGFAFLVTITVVIALFIARPGGNAATAVAFGGFAGLAAINTIKGGAILMAINARRRMISRPALAYRVAMMSTGLRRAAGPAARGWRAVPRWLRRPRLLS